MKIIKLDSVDSTNTYAKDNADNIKENTLIITDIQTSGYGTNNRNWYSDKDSIICSFLIKNNRNILPLNYSYKISSIVSNLLNRICNVKTYIKEPNDIYLNNKKLGGILIETKYLKDKLLYVVIGIGININQKEMPDDIRDISTSLSIETNKKYDKEEIISGLISDIEREVNR